MYIECIYQESEDVYVEDMFGLYLNLSLCVSGKDQFEKGRP